MFSDLIKIHVRSGKGGDGAISMRREKYVPKGGPDGGDGGQGGSIVFVANPNVNTLFHLHHKKIYIAQDGRPGSGQQCHGHKGIDMEIEVPPGTIIFEIDGKKKNPVCDLEEGSRFIYLQGGRGGFGNAHFTSSVRQTPIFAELGEPGKDRDVVLELKLVADIGIIGFPSVGKSTLISRISAAKPKIAEYPFTTIVPNLGVVSAGEETFVACDIPGIIEGAHKGKGLGHQFLRHVERCKILLHLLDLTREDPVKDFRVLNTELKKYSKKLADKFQLVAINKTDAIDTKLTDKIKTKVEKLIAKKSDRFHNQAMLMSAVTGDGIDKLIYKMMELIKTNIVDSTADVVTEQVKVFKPITDVHSFAVKRRKGFFEVTGQRIEQIAVMTDRTNRQAMARLYDVIKKMDIDRELRRKGAKAGSKIRVSNKTLEFLG